MWPWLRRLLYPRPTPPDPRDGFIGFLVLQDIGDGHWHMIGEIKRRFPLSQHGVVNVQLAEMVRDGLLEYGVITLGEDRESAYRMRRREPS